MNPEMLTEHLSAVRSHFVIQPDKDPAYLKTLYELLTKSLDSNTTTDIVAIKQNWQQVMQLVIPLTNTLPSIINDYNQLWYATKIIKHALKSWKKRPRITLTYALRPRSLTCILLCYAFTDTAHAATAFIPITIAQLSSAQSPREHAEIVESLHKKIFTRHRPTNFRLACKQQITNLVTLIYLHALPETTVTWRQKENNRAIRFHQVRDTQLEKICRNYILKARKKIKSHQNNNN